MAQPGTKSPPTKFAKSGADTKLSYSPGAKHVKCVSIGITEAADIRKAPTSRIYTKDYSKVGRAKDDTDTVTVALGNPFRL